jgi:hypothetical protein
MPSMTYEKSPPPETFFAELSADKGGDTVLVPLAGPR